MKTHILIIGTLFLSIYLISCKGNINDVEKDFLANAVVQLNIDKQYDWIVVLPGVGCHGCIQEGEFFMKNNCSNAKILFILTNISSLKIFQQKTGINISKYPNIYIDRDNQFKLSTDNGIYPCIIQMKDGEFLQYSFQSPETAAFHNLKKNI